MGYRIDIDHRGCITCGVCMDVCPVEALDMTRPDGAGDRDGPGLRAAAALDDGASAPGRRVHRLRHLHPRVPARRDDARHAAAATRSRWRRARARSSGRPPSTADRPGCRSPQVTREALKPVHDSPWGDLFAWRTRSRPKPWQVWTTMVDEAPASPIAPCQEACPAGTDAGRYVGLVGAGPLRRGVRGRRRGQPVPVGLRLDLHRAVRGGLPPRRPRRADRDPDPQALRRRARQAAGRTRARHAARREGRDRRRRPRRHVGRLVPRPPRLPGHRARGDAGPGRHDGDRHPRVPPAARGPPGRDRSGSSTRASSSGWTPRWAATSRCPTSSARASGRSSSPRAPRRAAAWASPATTCGASSRPPGSSRRSTSASTRGSPAT